MPWEAFDHYAVCAVTAPHLRLDGCHLLLRVLRLLQQPLHQLLAGRSCLHYAGVRDLQTLREAGLRRR